MCPPWFSKGPYPPSPNEAGTAGASIQEYDSLYDSSRPGVDLRDHLPHSTPIQLANSSGGGGIDRGCNADFEVDLAPSLFVRVVMLHADPQSPQQHQEAGLRKAKLLGHRKNIIIEDR